MSSFEYNKLINYPEINIDLSQYKDKVFVRVDTKIYKIDIEKLIKDYGSLVEIIYDNK